MPYPKLGSINEVIGYIGVPGTGKTTLALKDLKIKSTRYGGAYMLAHDIGMRIPSAWPDAWGGGPTGVVHYATIDDARKAIRGNPRGVHVIEVADGGEVLALAKSLGKELVTRARAGDGTAPAVLVMLDEAVGTASMNPHRLGDEMRDFIAGRRHYHAGLLWTTQDPSFAHYALLGLATELVLGRCTDEMAIKRFERFGVDQRVAESLSDLPDFQFYRVRPGRPYQGAIHEVDHRNRANGYRQNDGTDDNPSLPTDGVDSGNASESARGSARDDGKATLS